MVLEYIRMKKQFIKYDEGAFLFQFLENEVLKEMKPIYDWKRIHK